MFYQEFANGGGSFPCVNGVDTTTFTIASETITGPVNCIYTIERYYTIVDSCGPTLDSCLQTITIQDNTNPTASNPAPVAVQCAADIPAVDVTVVNDEADNCTANPTVTHLSDVSDNNSCPETITRTYRITDDCGNFIDVQQTITVNDNTNPTASNPAPVAVQCTADIPAVDVTVVNDEADNCTANPTVTHLSDVSDNNSCPETITRTYRITDDCGNFIDVQQTITVNDNTNPTASNPAPVAVQCAADIPAVDVTVVNDEADNCTANPTVTHLSDVSDNNSCPETITRTYRITDDCGNFIDVQQTITVNDNTNPTASNPAPVAVQCAADIPTVDVTVVNDEADNCTANPTVTHLSDVSDNNSCPETITRTYRITDDCGNFIDVQQTITVNDNTNPTASNPAPVAVQCAADIPAVDVTVVNDEADNCTANPTVTHLSDVSDNNSCPETITRTYRITDDCGNFIDVQQTITVNDNTNPTASNPAPVAVQCTADIPAVDVTVVNDEADNCTANPTVTHLSDVSDNNSCPETITRTYRITDDCGNFIDVQQTITVNDNTNPTASNPAPVAVQCAADIPAVDVTVVNDEADNCTANPTVTHLSDVSDNNSCPETITRTYRITDDCGNFIDVQQTITVNDNTNPTASNPAPVAVQCTADIPAVDVTVVNDEADNCTANPTVTHLSDVSDNNSCPETITRTYRITDDCGNFIDVQQTITVNDNTNPTASNPAPVAVQCTADIPAVDVTVVNDEADNCTANPTVTHLSDVSDNNSCPETITRTYRITDDCGNFIDVQQTITVNDNTNPTASNPAPVAVQCTADIPAVDVTVVTDEADNCTVNPTVTHLSDVSDNNSCPETITRTYRITDDCGNFIDVQQTITVNDNTNPTASNTAPVAVQCTADIPAVDVTVVTDEADNCTVNPTVTHLSDVSDNNSCPETITRTYRITDDCGNFIDVQQTITVNDNTNPTGSNPAPVAVQCTADIPAVDVTVVTDEADNCTVNPTVTHLSDVSDNNSCPETITRTYRITDDCGNFIDVQQTITINDNIDPTADPLPNLGPFQCYADIPAADINDVMNETDNCGGTVIVSFVSDSPDPGCSGNVTRTYELEDDCGNTAQIQQTISIQDNTPPTADPLPDLGPYDCYFNIPAPDINEVTGEQDNCGGIVTVIHVSTSGDPGCSGTVTRVYRITDACGNSADLSQNILIDDNIPPVFGIGAPADITVQCMSNVPPPGAPIPWFDNCGGSGSAVAVTVSDGNSCPRTLTRTWTADDGCGNTAVLTQMIVVNDTMPPVFSLPPADVTVSCSADVPAPVNLTYLENCLFFGVSVLPVDVSDGNSCPEVITRTWTATDSCNNTTSVQQQITVWDQVPPVFVNPPGDITVECDADVPAASPLDWTDNCDGMGSVPASDVDDGNTCPRIITRTWTYTDACNNSVTHNQQITVDDTTDPVFTSPPTDITVSCPADIPALTSLVWTDNCDGTGNVSGSEVSDGMSCPETITRTWTYTDACNNTVTYNQTIVVDDQDFPVFDPPPGNVTVECIDDVPPMVALNWTDNCDGAGSVPGTDLSDGNTCPETITRSWSYTDGCGNTSTVIQTITVEDTTFPVFSNPPPHITIECAADMPAMTMLSYTDNCAPPGSVTGTDLSDNGSCPEIITRSWSFTDSCGNTTTAIQSITILGRCRSGF